MPVLGGYLADARWGRFKTLCIAVGITLVGHALLIIAAIPSVIANKDGKLKKTSDILKANLTLLTLLNLPSMYGRLCPRYYYHGARNWMVQILW